MQRLKLAIPARLRRTLHWGWLVALAAMVLIAAFAVPHAQPKGRAAAADDGSLLAAAASLGEAARAGDRAAARRLLALQFSFVDAGGKIHGRRDVLGDLKAVGAAGAAAKVGSYGQLAAVSGPRQTADDTDAFFLGIWAKQKGAWRALLMQHVPVAAAEPPPAAAAAGSEPKQYECRNPCQTIPYRVRSPAEQEIINTYQAIVKAIVAHDAGEWAKHVADEFMLYSSGRAPVPKSGRIAAIEHQKESNTTVAVGEVQAMRLSVYGDGAAMITTETAPDNPHPPYRAVRVWVKRNGQWLMAISAHTEVK